MRGMVLICGLAYVAGRVLWAYTGVQERLVGGKRYALRVQSGNTPES
jgi:uncharacterized membrane protein YecN with MAPEG domain